MKKIRDFRKAKGFTQEDLAIRSGYSRNSIINWETGKRAPRTVNIERLANVLGVSPSDFLENGNNYSNNSSNQINKQTIMQSHQENQSDSFAYWSGVLDKVLKIAQNKDMQEIKKITPLLQSALNILLSVQEHVATADETASGVSAFNGNHSSYSGNTVSVGTQG